MINLVTKASLGDFLGAIDIGGTSTCESTFYLVRNSASGIPLRLPLSLGEEMEGMSCDDLRSSDGPSILCFSDGPLDVHLRLSSAERVCSGHGRARGALRLAIPNARSYHRIVGVASGIPARLD